MICETISFFPGGHRKAMRNFSTWSRNRISIAERLVITARYHHVYADEWKSVQQQFYMELHYYDQWNWNYQPYCQTFVKNLIISRGIKVESGCWRISIKYSVGRRWSQSFNFDDKSALNKKWKGEGGQGLTNRSPALQDLGLA